MRRKTNHWVRKWAGKQKIKKTYLLGFMAKNENLDDTGSKREMQIKESELGLWSVTRKLTIARRIEENNLNL